jgi:hypothetical protein
VRFLMMRGRMLVSRWSRVLRGTGGLFRRIRWGMSLGLIISEGGEERAES